MADSFVFNSNHIHIMLLIVKSVFLLVKYRLLSKNQGNYRLSILLYVSGYLSFTDWVLEDLVELGLLCKIGRGVLRNEVFKG